MKSANPPKTGSKHEQRTAATQVKLLEAAENVFTRDGYANARLEQIAIEAGYTRGAIYAHYKSKEDLFLVLFEQRMQASIAEFNELIEGSATPEERLLGLKKRLISKASDKGWAMLVLEFKLFARRQPRLKARMQRLVSMLHTTSRSEYLCELLGGVKAKDARKVQRRMALLGAILTAAVLESYFRPKLLSDKNLNEVLWEVFEAVVRK